MRYKMGVKRRSGGTCRARFAWKIGWDNFDQSLGHISTTTQTQHVHTCQFYIDGGTSSSDFPSPRRLLFSALRCSNDARAEETLIGCNHHFAVCEPIAVVPVLMATGRGVCPHSIKCVYLYVSGWRTRTTSNASQNGRKCPSHINEDNHHHRQDIWSRRCNCCDKRKQHSENPHSSHGRQRRWRTQRRSKTCCPRRHQQRRCPNTGTFPCSFKVDGKPIAAKNMGIPQRQPLGIIHQQLHHHVPSTSSLDDIEDAEIIAIDTPGKPSDNLQDQFTEVDEEFHESRSTMDIDSDDPTTEPDDTDTETTIDSKRICVPSTTRHDREELRIVRNNFAEEYDPWDTSMVPDYAEDIFRYMRELEVSSHALNAFPSERKY